MSGYDPVPALAALIDGVHDLAASGGDPAVLAELLVGPYARLRGGLLLDEPSWEGPPGTEQALREALAAYTGQNPVRTTRRSQ